ncbi:hypothetical protein J6590_069064 [Homalodisca vitripennis]|nr:hypothetical protein J6590_069064 [Homalodisca vitripennis]
MDELGVLFRKQDIVIRFKSNSKQQGRSTPDHVMPKDYTKDRNATYTNIKVDLAYRESEEYYSNSTYTNNKCSSIEKGRTNICSDSLNLRGSSSPRTQCNKTTKACEKLVSVLRLIENGIRLSTPSILGYATSTSLEKKRIPL